MLDGVILAAGRTHRKVYPVYPGAVGITETRAGFQMEASVKQATFAVTRPIPLAGHGVIIWVETLCHGITAIYLSAQVIIITYHQSNIVSFTLNLAANWSICFLHLAVLRS